MKKILLGSLVLLMFSASIVLFNISCNKDSDAQPNPTSSNCIGPQPKFQFKANGKLYVCDAVFDKRLGWVANRAPFVYNENIPFLDVYDSESILSGSVYSSSTNSSLTTINLAINTTNPSVGTFNETNVYGECNFDFDDYTYTVHSHTITFTRVSDGTADGKFSGVTKVASNPNQSVSITDGVFSNIPIVQN